MADPVTDQPTTETKEESSPSEENPAQGDGAASSGGVVKSTSWWGVSSLTSYLASPHLLEQGINNVASSMAQATTGAAQMVKSKSMDVVKAVSEDLTEIKDSAVQYTSNVSQYTAPVKKAGGALKNTLKDIDEITDDMAESAINGVSKGASSLWNMASGYASQMFVEEDLEATPVMVGGNHEPIILDRLQAQLHALASDTDTYTGDPDLSDCGAEEWTAYLGDLDLDKRQGEISELMINNNHIRKNYSSLVPGKVQHKLFWARYFYKVHLIEKQEAKRQVLKKRAEQTKVDSDSEINWDEDDEDLENVQDIPDAVQEKLLSEYEAELKTKKPTHAKKDSNASDDWDKLSDEGK